MQNATVQRLAEFVKERETRIEETEINWSEMLKKDDTGMDLPRSAFYHTIIMGMAWLWFSLYFRVRQEGAKELPDGPFILAPNHQSFVDGLFITMFLKSKLLKNTYFFAKGKHFGQRWRTFLAQRNNVIVMGEKVGLMDSLAKMAAVLRRKKNIIIFPEGTRTRTGAIGKFKQSFAILSKELNVPVVPVVINGAYEAMPKGSLFAMPFKRIQVKFLAPVFPGDLSYDGITSTVHRRIVENFG
jgi:long-chain acyl-CoA synthetase